MFRSHNSNTIGKRIYTMADTYFAHIPKQACWDNMEARNPITTTTTAIEQQATAQAICSGTNKKIDMAVKAKMDGIKMV